MNDLLKWIVLSSADPENVSLTIKGLLLQHVGLAIAVAGVFGYSVTDITIATIITKISIIIGGFLAMIGIVRKIYFLVKESNK